MAEGGDGVWGGGLWCRLIGWRRCSIPAASLSLFYFPSAVWSKKVRKTRLTCIAGRVECKQPPVRRLQEENPQTGTHASVSPHVPNTFPWNDVLD